MDNFFPPVYFPISLNVFTPITSFFLHSSSFTKNIIARGLELTFYMFLQGGFFVWTKREKITEENLEGEVKDKPYDLTLLQISDNYYTGKLVFTSIVLYKVVSFGSPASRLTLFPLPVITTLVKNILQKLPFFLKRILEYLLHIPSSAAQFTNLESLINTSFRNIFNSTTKFPFQNISALMKSGFCSVSPINIGIVYLLVEGLNLKGLNHSLFFFSVQIINAIFMRLFSIKGKLMNMRPNSVQSDLGGFFLVRDKFLSILSLPISKTLPGFLTVGIFELTSAIIRYELFSKLHFPVSSFGIFKSFNGAAYKLGEQSSLSFLTSWIESLCNSFGAGNLIKKYKPHLLELLKKASQKVRELEKNLYQHMLKSLKIDPSMLKMNPELQSRINSQMLAIKNQFAETIDSKVLEITSLLEGLINNRFTFNLPISFLLSFSVSKLPSLLGLLKSEEELSFGIEMKILSINLIALISLIMQNFFLLRAKNYLKT